MKANLFNIILAVVIFTVVASTLMISTTVVQPYSEDTIFAQQFPYEGFSNYSNVNDSPNTDAGINNFLLDTKVSDWVCVKFRLFRE